MQPTGVKYDRSSQKNKTVLDMGSLFTRVNEIMDKIYEDSVFSVDRE